MPSLGCAGSYFLTIEGCCSLLFSDFPERFLQRLYILSSVVLEVSIPSEISLKAKKLNKILKMIPLQHRGKKKDQKITPNTSPKKSHQIPLHTKYLFADGL